MLNKVVKAQLIESQEDFCGYITYVFMLLETDEISKLGTKYIMCVRFPNWDTPMYNLDTIGYLQFKEIIAGESSWFDGQSFIKYRYNNIQFIKFVPETIEESSATM